LFFLSGVKPTPLSAPCLVAGNYNQPEDDDNVDKKDDNGIAFTHVFEFAPVEFLEKIAAAFPSVK
jgi:hypothetical protein